MSRAEIVEIVRGHLQLVERPVVWLTERGAIVLAPNGQTVCIKGIGRDYFKGYSQLMFIEGVGSLSAIGARSGESVGSGVLDEGMHERMWSESDNPQ